MEIKGLEAVLAGLADLTQKFGEQTYHTARAVRHRLTEAIDARAEISIPQSTEKIETYLAVLGDEGYALQFLARDMFGTFEKGLITMPERRENTFNCYRATPNGIEVADVSLLDRPVYNIPISELDLSVRAYSCLEVAGIETVGELLKKTPQELLTLRSFGKTSLREVNQKLDSMGLAFGQRRRSGYSHEDLNIHISELDITQRARNGLIKVGVTYLGELAQKTKDELREIGRLGETSIQEIESTLGSKGLGLGMDIHYTPPERSQ